MNEAERLRAEASGLRLQARLHLGPAAGPSKVRVVNAEWAEADRLGRLLLDHFDAQDTARRGPTETEET